MRKRNKIITTALIFMLFLNGGVTYSSDISCLRIPIGAKEREEETLRVLSEKRPKPMVVALTESEIIENMRQSMFSLMASWGNYSLNADTMDPGLLTAEQVVKSCFKGDEIGNIFTPVVTCLSIYKTSTEIKKANEAIRKALKVCDDIIKRYDDTLLEKLQDDPSLNNQIIFHLRNDFITEKQVKDMDNLKPEQIRTIIQRSIDDLKFVVKRLKLNFDALTQVRHGEIVVEELPGDSPGKSHTLSVKFDKEAIGRILESGFIFNEYVRTALYDSDFGFYGSGKVKLGSDFGTCAIALSPAYGEMVAEQVFKMWQGMARNKSLKDDDIFYIIECGAGLGIMARDILNHISTKAESNGEWAEFYNQLKYEIFEVSSKHAESQKKTTQKFSDKIEIKKIDALKIEETLGAGAIKGAVITDELIDSLESYDVKFKLDGTVEVGVAIMALNKELLQIAETEAGIHILNELERRGIVESKKLLEEHAKIGVKDAKRIYINRERFIEIKKALSRDGMGDLERVFNICIEGAMFHVPIQYVKDDKIKTYIMKHIDEIAAAVSKSTKDIKINLIPDGDNFIMAAGKVLDKGYIITMDSGGSMSEMFKNGGGNIATYGMGTEQTYYLGFTGDADICVSPIFTTLADAGKQAGLDAIFYGSKFNLEKGVPVKISTGENDERLIRAFARMAVLMNLEDWSMEQKGIPADLWDDFRSITHELLDGEKPNEINGWVDLTKIQTLTPVSYRLKFISDCNDLLKWAHNQAMEMIPLWKERFLSSHKIFIQQKRGTDPSYSFEGEKEELFTKEDMAKQLNIKKAISSSIGLNENTGLSENLPSIGLGVYL